MAAERKTKIVLVEDEHIVAGMRMLAKDAKLIAEPGVGDALGLQRGLQGFAVELRISARIGSASYIGDRSDACA